MNVRFGGLTLQKNRKRSVSMPFCPMHSALESLRSALEPLLRGQLRVPLTEMVYYQLAFYAVMPYCTTLTVGMSCCGAGFEVCGAEACEAIGP